MSNESKKNQPLKQYKHLTFLTMLYLTIMLVSAVLIYKPVEMWFGYASGATLIFPFWFVLSDIIAEVYGLQISKKLLLTGFFCQLIFSFICLVMIRTPSPHSWHNQFAFDLVLGHLVKITFVAFATILVSGYLNIYLVTKWKTLLQGRYFWMRSIGASAIGEGIYSVIAVTLIQYKMVPLSAIPAIIFWAYVLKISCTVILATPASLICNLLKESEDVDIYEMIHINPFKSETG